MSVCLSVRGRQKDKPKDLVRWIKGGVRFCRHGALVLVGWFSDAN